MCSPLGVACAPHRPIPLALQSGPESVPALRVPFWFILALTVRPLYCKA